jgi:hypothetical protein
MGREWQNCGTEVKSPRVLDDGAKVGWGLVVLISSIYGGMVLATGALSTWVWNRRTKR